MAKRWGITIPLEGLPMRDHRQPLREAEALGYTDAWTAEVNAGDAFVPLAAAAAWTDMRLGTAIANIYTRTPTLIAQSAAAMADLAPGRFCLGLGTSSPAIVENWNGVRLERPLERMRETITFVKQALTGEKTVASNRWFDVKGFRLGRAPAAPPPIFVAALRERMLRLGAEMAEGVITNYISPEDARKIAAVAKDAARLAGKDPEKVDVACRIFVIATEDAAAAQMVGRLAVSAYLTTPFYYALHEWLGRGDLLSPMMSAWRAGERQQAASLVPPQVVEDSLRLRQPPAVPREDRGLLRERHHGADPEHHPNGPRSQRPAGAEPALAEGAGAGLRASRTDGEKPEIEVPFDCAQDRLRQAQDERAL